MVLLLSSIGTSGQYVPVLPQTFVAFLLIQEKSHYETVIFPSQLTGKFFRHFDCVCILVFFFYVYEFLINFAVVF